MSLAVVYQSRSAEEINRELRRLDPNLYLDQAVDYPGGPVYYVVRHNLGSGWGNQVIVVAWKEHDGTPKPLTHGIVDQVKRQENRAADVAAEVVRDYERTLERKRQQRKDDHDALMADHLPRVKASWDGFFTPYSKRITKAIGEK